MSAQRPLFDPERMRGPEKPRPGSRPLTVSQLNAMVRSILNEELPSLLHVVGEISNLSRPASGHLYLTLKDKRSEVRCIMWRSAAAALKFEPADGLEVIATGHVDLFEPRGQYQFYIRRLEPRGAGALELAFQQLRERLEREGLFDPARKKPVPRYPRHIGVVTSATGAAIRDILKTLQRRFPCVCVTLHPVPVQGEGAAEQIAAAIHRFNQYAERLGGIDVLIVGRGGGSLEDLWAFNEEIVARAIAASRIPIISAVGHEVDVTIADLAADLRAPTPTAGAELAVPVLEDVLDLLAERAARLQRTARHCLELGKARLEALARTPWLRDPMTLVQYAALPLDELSHRLQRSVSHFIGQIRGRVSNVEQALAAVHPRRVVHRHGQRLAALDARLRWHIASRLAVGRNDLHAAEIRWVHAHPRNRLQRDRNCLRDAARTLVWTARRRLQDNRHCLIEARHRLARSGRIRRIPADRQRIEYLASLLDRAMHARLRSTRRHVNHLAAMLEAGSYHKVLARGFTITRRKRDAAIITRADAVRPGDEIVTETADGAFASRVNHDPPNLPD